MKRRLFTQAIPSQIAPEPKPKKKPRPKAKSRTRRPAIGSEDHIRLLLEARDREVRHAQEERDRALEDVRRRLREMQELQESEHQRWGHEKTPIRKAPTITF